MQAQPDHRINSRPSSYRGIVRLLRRNQAGNVLPVMAMAIIPLAGLVGGSVDMSRMYLAKSRLQQACDAGALAGRKVMGAGAWNANSNAANTAALQFFDGNFASGAYGTVPTGQTGGLTRSFNESGGKVTGTASVTVPMSVMKMFGVETKTISVSCDAELRLPNTDIMFVLDTTGSMANKAVSSDTQTKIQALRSAVKCFYEIVARVDTSEVCTTGTPSGGVSSATQIRFGFVPYATNVNVGRLLPKSYFADSWYYQTRKAETRDVTTYTFPNQGTPTVTSTEYRDFNNAPSSSWTNFSQVTSITDDDDCDDMPDPAPLLGSPSGAESSPQNENTVTSGGTRTTTWYTDQTYSGTRRRYDWNNSKCWIQHRAAFFDVRRYYNRVDTGVAQVSPVFDRWHYGRHLMNISALKNGTVSATNPYGWASSFTLPIGNSTDGNPVNNKTINWDGCIEERETIKASSYTSQTGGSAKDLDIDTVPSVGNAGSMWGPALHDMIYARTSSAGSLNADDIGGFSMTDAYTENNYATIDGNNLDSYYCPTEAKKLQQWSTTATGSPALLPFEHYVNGLTINGNTYHDIGLIWGARLISPTGIFATENAFTPLGGEIERHLIFMTDGETCTGSVNYGPYGFPWFDRRQTDSATAPTYGCETESSTGGTLSEQVNARYSAVCTSVKNKNITLWVIWFGESKPNLEARLTNCATSGRFFAARSSAELQATFASIANQISQLRLTR